MASPDLDLANTGTGTNSAGRELADPMIAEALGPRAWDDLLLLLAMSEARIAPASRTRCPVAARAGEGMAPGQSVYDVLMDCAWPGRARRPRSPS